MSPEAGKAAPGRANRMLGRERPKNQANRGVQDRVIWSHQQVYQEGSHKAYLCCTSIMLRDGCVICGLGAK